MKKYRGHVTEREREQIRVLTLRGVRQSVIARELGITAESVSKAQRAMGLPTKLPTPEAKIMELFHQGWGGYRISKFLHVPANRVWATAHKNGFQNPDCRPTDPANEAAFIEAVKRREDYIVRLARKYHVAFCRANRLAHEILRTLRFRPGVAKPVLSSNFPQRHSRRDRHPG